MGVSNVLARAAVTRCHVFVAEVLHGAGPRMAAEREIAHRGWVEALSPAGADILCVCGDVPGDQGAALDRLWDGLPGPRSRVQIRRAEDVVVLLDGCVAELLDVNKQRQHEAERSTDRDESGPSSAPGVGVDHSGMEMPMPGGISLAGEGRDRDGLNLDRLKVPLGPYLPLWPAGVVLHCELQGDVVFASTVEYAFGQQPVRGPDTRDRDDRFFMVRFTDLAARLLHVAGADDGARRVRIVRDAALDGKALDQCRREVEAEQSRLSRAWLLRRKLQGIGHVRAGSGLTLLEGTDVWDRLLGMLGAAAAGAPAPGPKAQGMAGALPQLVRGQELSVVRVIVASLDLSPVAVPVELAP